MSSALFERDGDAFLPTELSSGPWSADALHGGPPTALLARAIERFEGGARLQVVRVTMELLRPVPRKPLTVATRLTRPGKNVELVEATLLDGDRAVSRATGLRIRREQVPLPEDLIVPDDPPPRGPDGVAGGRASSKFHQGFHTLSVDYRFVEGGFVGLGPATGWLRLRYPLLEGEETSPLCRVCALADFGNGLSNVLRRSYTYINPDLTVYLQRLPEGEWICLSAVTELGQEGVGLAESALYDTRGRIGRSLQSLLIAQR